ncbi:MAG: glutathione-regulated potassium-efflux system protein KefB [Candidatus Muproteobacteria bacterium RBG_16_65_34]|uniref:Glutathione-regulated potassium-efflux system protein KefB n=1 Tax=Candidatus Muproteobacteria bacterium RBG_16_65_34 TaxID=1817760 RepID=A0A1F6TJT8_9PROT|nr:MAG: glutathione-regulated potassium-efflux system protein KefB [Candidatus Muproteobacteria bacterium RBG_16_65_34]
MDTSLLHEAVVFLAAAVITVPLFKRLGIGAVLGYLAAGVLIGPWLLGFVRDVENILHFAELGVVLLLFIIGLELQPSRLWALRKPVFGLGSAQVLATGLALALAGFVLGLSAATALIVGLVLSFSSTALALQLLAEKKQLPTHHGRASFAILLFQDLAAIPLLAIIPLLGVGTSGIDRGGSALAIASAIALIAAVVVGGRWLLRPFLRLAASATDREIFTAAALLVVVGTALLMEQAGLSMALGSFLAGVLLADSEYRHELEADIEPFKGLLLGLFFIAVGISVDLGLVLHRPLTVLGLVAGLMATKALTLYGLGRIARQSHASSVNLALFLSQGGEFAFVLFGVAAGAQAMDKALADLLIVVVSASMVLTPLLVSLNERILKIGYSAAPPREFDRIEDRDHRVIIAGFGRFGQMVARTLRLKKIPFTALEASFEQVDFVRKYGSKIYFGDASRLDLLRAARADQAEAFVLAIDDVEASVKTAQMVKKHYPHLKIYARARNRQHAYRLMDVGVERIMRETFLSSLELARDVLLGLGYSAVEANAAVHKFREHDEALLERQHKIYRDEAQLIAAARQGAEELERLFEQDTGAAK